MNIKHFSEITGLSQHTLRYYEKIGLLHPVRRQANNHRDYSEKDLEWIRFIKRLKDTQMPPKEIRMYARLRDDGDHTASQRLEILERHQLRVNEHISQLQHHKEKINQKIDLYTQWIEAEGKKDSK